MASWLVKTEPGEYSWADLVRDRRTHWDGVTNPQAQLNLRTMAKGDTVVVYHSQTDKAAVGIAKVVKAGYPDPTDEAGKRVWVDIAPVDALA
ncbi:MAG TPA: EVE domain-containing protein, partial [Acidimicrobiales bacterium]|nr:EVE domain-containing protein [Acidimicrobiales bacterium]